MSLLVAGVVVLVGVLRQLIYWGHLPAAESGEMVTELENERALTRGVGFKDLMKEMWLIPGNRRRVVLVVVLMICRQMTGTNTINNYAPPIFRNIGI